MPLLSVSGLTKNFSGIVANDRIDFDLEEGEIHAVIGPNGAGKTTFVSQIIGEQMSDAGTIKLGGVDVTKRGMSERADLGVSRCYQVSRVFLDMTAIDNVALGVLARSDGHLRWWRPFRSDAKVYGEAEAFLAKMGLQARADTEAGDLSHGERKQLEFAMALATNPRLILLDEPMAGLGPTECKTLISLIGSFRGTKSVLLIEHDMEAVFALADRITVLVNGKVIACGTTQEVVENPLVQEAYLAASDGGH